MKSRPALNFATAFTWVSKVPFHRYQFLQKMTKTTMPHEESDWTWVPLETPLSMQTVERRHQTNARHGRMGRHRPSLCSLSTRLCWRQGRRHHHFGTTFTLLGSWRWIHRRCHPGRGPGPKRMLPARSNSDASPTKHSSGNADLQTVFEVGCISTHLMATLFVFHLQCGKNVELLRN